MDVKRPCPFCGKLCHGFREYIHCNYYYEPADCSECGASENLYKGDQRPGEDRLLDADEKRSGWVRGEAATCRRPCDLNFEEWLQDWSFENGPRLLEDLKDTDQPLCECPNCQAVRWLCEVQVVHVDGVMPTALELVEGFLRQLKFGDQTDQLI